MNIISLIIIFFVQREVLFLEAESGKIIEETFDSLIKSDLAVHSLKQLKSKNLREVRTCSTLNILSPSQNQVIGKKYMKKVDCIISKFSKEIDAADELFETKCDDPPVEDSLPPISGSIYWSQGIGQLQLFGTLSNFFCYRRRTKVYTGTA